jgi:hypothetical protein
LVSTVFTEDDRRNLKVIAAELLELQKLIEELTESLVNISDKKLLKMLNESQDDLNENQVQNFKEKLEKQVYIAEKEFRS